MTAWTPDLKIFTVPPNTSIAGSSPRTEITDWVDYSIVTSRGTSEYINPPYPAATQISLLFNEDVIPDIELGSFVELRYFASIYGSYETIHSGYVTNRSSRYRFNGTTGFVLEWVYSLTSAISILQNTSWYNPSTFTGTTNDCIELVYSQFGLRRWEQVNSNTTWLDIGPYTWANLDNARTLNLPDVVIAPLGFVNTTEQRLTAGYRNIWDDLVTLMYGLYNFIDEGNDGDLFLSMEPESVSFLTLTQDMLNTDITGGDRFDQLRNEITITKWDDTSLTYSDDNSINLYSERSGTLKTFLTQDLDTANVAQRILNNMAYPLLSTETVSVNLLNPIFTTEQRELLLYPIGNRFTIEAPEPMGGTLDYTCIGNNREINKNAFICTLTLVPYSQIEHSKNWLQIPYNYNWTSYGVAFPLQKWQDL